MKVLIGCEYSARVRDAFRKLGHDAWSCDYLPCEGDPTWHLQMDVRAALTLTWDLFIVHPTCTYLCSSGLHWNKRVPGRQRLTEQALEFVLEMLSADVPRIGLENPVGCISTRIRPPDQIIQPWQFGHPESKATCLWLKGLPPLSPTNVLSLPETGRWDNQTPSGQNKLAPGPDRWKDRSRTYEGVAQAMAEQWGKLK